MFARLRLQRLADSLSSRYVVVERTVLHRSPIVLTPYSAGNTIDAAALEAHIAGWYAAAGLAREDVDTGAVILTGAALEQDNARELADLFAGEGGKFVCATAGHALEATLAAHGSGSVARSRREHETILHVDVGGGTTKLARIEDGLIVATTAIGVGARSRAAGRDPAERKRIAGGLADLIVAATRGAPVPAALQLLAPLPRGSAPGRITLSGGVSEYLAGRERADYDDLGRELAEAIDARRGELPAPLEVVADGIRATVIGASQFTVQVSGSTIGVGATLPLRNVPVVRLGGDVRGSGPTDTRSDPARVSALDAPAAGAAIDDGTRDGVDHVGEDRGRRRLAQDVGLRRGVDGHDPGRSSQVGAGRRRMADQALRPPQRQRRGGDTGGEGADAQASQLADPALGDALDLLAGQVAGSLRERDLGDEGGGLRPERRGQGGRIGLVRMGVAGTQAHPDQGDGDGGKQGEDAARFGPASSSRKLLGECVHHGGRSPSPGISEGRPPKR